MGYEGLIVDNQYVPLHLLIDVASKYNIWGIATNEARFDSEFFAQCCRDLYQERQQRYGMPGGSMPITLPMGYANLMFLAQVIEQAQSIDVDKVTRVIDDPAFTFDSCLVAEAKL